MSVRSALRRSRVGSLSIATAAVTLGVVASAPSANALLTYRVGDFIEVNVRTNTTDPLHCSDYPSVKACPDIVTQVNKGQTVYVICQKRGETVEGRNPYWLLVEANRTVGWMASYFIDYPLNRVPDVPDCL
jgi:hypothetical protein